MVAVFSCAVYVAGVSWREGKYWVQIRVGQYHKHGGIFDDEIEAARKYDAVARRLRGDKAHGEKLNHFALKTKILVLCVSFVCFCRESPA